jgi:hypothetical protein
MSQALKFSRTKSPKNRKGGSVYTMELQIPQWIVKSFCSPKWVESMREKHSKKIKFVLKAPKDDKVCGEKECGEKECGEKECGEKECGEKECGEKECGEKECGHNKVWTLVVTGKHKQSMLDLGLDASDRYNKMICVIKNIVKE